MNLVLPNNTTLITAHLFFEKNYNINDARSVAKKVLSVHRSNLKLWDSYAQMELQAGNPDKAKQVYTTALSLLSTVDPKFRDDAPLLIRNFAELELQLKNTQNALNILISAVESSKFQPLDKPEIPATRILKAKKVKIKIQIC